MILGDAEALVEMFCPLKTRHAYLIFQETAVKSVSLEINVYFKFRF